MAKNNDRLRKIQKWGGVKNCFHMTSRWPYWCKKQWMGIWLVYQKITVRDWTLFSSKNFLLFQKICIATDYVSENDP